MTGNIHYNYFSLTLNLSQFFLNMNISSVDNYSKMLRPNILSRYTLKEIDESIVFLIQRRCNVMYPVVYDTQTKTL